MNHSYDRHSKKCFGMEGNQNKENVKEFDRKIRSFIESASKTRKINVSYRYKTPAYIYEESGNGNLVVIVNATDNSFISVVNATEGQLDNLATTKNFGLDTRITMELKFRVPKQ